MIRVAICDDNKVFVNNMSQAVKSEFKRQNNEDIELETYISSELMYQHHLIKPFDFERLKISIDKIFTRDEILNKSKVKQDSIDNIHSTPSSLNLPKGLNSKTLEKVTQIISNLPNEEFGIKDICQITDISNVTIKKYLDYLENIKYITSFTNYGNIGRPLYLYKKIR